MVEVFKTDVVKRSQSRSLIRKLLLYFPRTYINIDLDDCDNVLRVEGDDICADKIIKLVTDDGYSCEALS